MFDTGVGNMRRLIRVHDIIQSREKLNVKGKSVMFDTGVGNMRRLIRVHDIIQSRKGEQS